jgi:hypothetical protein
MKYDQRALLGDMHRLRNVSRLSKSTMNTARFLQAESRSSWLRMGRCLAQIGHQLAWIATRIGLLEASAAASAF